MKNTRKKSRERKYPLISTVCNYVVAHKKMSGRAVARAIKVAPSTWCDYTKGMICPRKAIKYRLVRLTGAASFSDLTQRALQYYRFTNKTIRL